MLSEQSQLWKYLSPEQQSLIREGYYLVEDSKTHVPLQPITDYSYLVFPFAKAYEGFLKQLFLDMQLIKRWQYESDHFRIGKALSPNWAKERKRNSSAYKRLAEKLGDVALPDELWRVWKQGRNLIFHYFPHNFKALTLPEAEVLVQQIVTVMERAVTVCLVGPHASSRSAN